MHLRIYSTVANLTRFLFNKLLSELALSILFGLTSTRFSQLIHFPFISERYTCFSVLLNVWFFKLLYSAGVLI